MRGRYGEIEVEMGKEDIFPPHISKKKQINTNNKNRTKLELRECGVLVNPQ